MSEPANDDEPLNDLRFGEPLFLIMVMDGGHEEGTILHRHGFVRRQAETSYCTHPYASYAKKIVVHIVKSN